MTWLATAVAFSGNIAIVEILEKKIREDYLKFIDFQLEKERFVPTFIEYKHAVICTRLILRKQEIKPKITVEDWREKNIECIPYKAKQETWKSILAVILTKAFRL